MSSHLSRDKPGYKAFLLGNEAIARGAIEAGVGVAAAYPGTPSTEILEALSEAAKDMGFYVEWSVNEKVAFEVAYAASMCGVRAITSMKHVGVNVAMDPLMTSGYTGANGGFVIVSADDPSCHSSQNEQDNRIVGVHAYLPVFEPSNIQEAKDLTRYAFDFSEEHRTPVILRSTTRLSHSRGIVEYGPIRKFKVKGEFQRDPKRWVVVPAHARRLREEQVERWRRIVDAVDKVPYNTLDLRDSEYAIIASGIASSYVGEALGELGIPGKVSVAKLVTPVPVPESLIVKVLEAADKVLVVEELEPVVELEVKRIAQERGFNVEVHGKDFVPRSGELTLDRVIRAIARFVGVDYSPPAGLTPPENLAPPPRPPVLCAGCPHRATFYAIRRAVNMARVNAIYPGDIGCYTLGVNPPFRLVDTTICMGGSIGLANGFAHVEDKVVIATIGDSTFYHAGIPGLINAVYNSSPLLLVIMDNETTAMTGHQPHPGVGYTALGTAATRVPIEDVVRAVGVGLVSVVDPYNLQETIRAIKEAIDYVVNNGRPAVVIARRLCSLVYVRRARRSGEEIPVYRVDPEKCTGCRVCTDHFACPAIAMRDEKAWIDSLLCTGCSVCAQICPYKAIGLRTGGR